MDVHQNYSSQMECIHNPIQYRSVFMQFAWYLFSFVGRKIYRTGYAGCSYCGKTLVAPQCQSERLRKAYHFILSAVLAAIYLPLVSSVLQTVCNSINLPRLLVISLVYLSFLLLLYGINHCLFAIRCTFHKWPAVASSSIEFDRAFTTTVSSIRKEDLKTGREMEFAGLSITLLILLKMSIAVVIFASATYLLGQSIYKKSYGKCCLLVILVFVSIVIIVFSFVIGDKFIQISNWVLLFSAIPVLFFS